MGIAILLAILALAETGIGIEMVNTPPTKNWHKWSWRIAFLIIGLGICLLTILQFKNSDAQQRDLSDRLGGVQIQLTNSFAENLQLHSEMTQQFQQLTEEFSTNSPIAVTLRLDILTNALARMIDEGNGVKVTVPDDTKVRWLQPGQIITNTWVKRKTAEASMGRGSFLVGISEPDTFVVDLVDARWRWPDIILQQGSVEARVRQIFRSASPDDPYPYMHGPDVALYSPVFTMDCSMIQLFSDPKTLEK